MARSRNIKPGFFRNEILGVADPLYSLLFEGLWVLADREGRLEDRPLRIKADIFPYREADADAMLGWLQDNEFILRYEAGGNRYIQIIQFVKHQNPHKNEVPSEIPAAPEKIKTKTAKARTHSEKIGTKPEKIGSTRADSLLLIPDSLNSDSGFLIPDSGFPSVPPAASPAVVPIKAETKTAKAWAAYSEAYRRRYNADPTSNAEQRTHMARFCELVPIEEAPEIAAFYVSHSKRWYVEHSHDLKYLKTDAASLRTQWLNGRSVTSTEAGQADKTQANGNVFGKLISEVEERERKHG